MALRNSLSQWWNNIQTNLFPWLEETLGPLTEKKQQLVSALEMLRLEEYISSHSWGPGRPQKSRVGIAAAFVAKSIYNMPTTSALIDRLHSDIQLRRICGWEKIKDIPSASVFSRAFSHFAETELLEKIHSTLIIETHNERIVGHISRDSTAIEAREEAKKKEKTKEGATPKKRGRPKKGEVRPTPEPTRIERQLHMTQAERISDLPKDCDIGTKKNSKGYKVSWKGYKLHIDTVDGGIPISCLITSASTHDSQVAIPLAEMSAKRVTSLYDLMDSAYNDPNIEAYSRSLGHVPIIDINPRRDVNLKKAMSDESKRKRLLGMQYAEEIRYKERSAAERTNARLKDDFGAKNIRVRGHKKVMCHLMFGVVALASLQLLKFVT